MTGVATASRPAQRGRRHPHCGRSGQAAGAQCARRDRAGVDVHRHQRVSTVPGPAQGTHRVAVRIASSRSCGIASPQSSHQPANPALRRSRARAARASISSACRAAPLAAQPLLTASHPSAFASRSTNARRRVCTQLVSTPTDAAGGTSSDGLIESKVVRPAGRAGCTPGTAPATCAARAAGRAREVRGGPPAAGEDVRRRGPRRAEPVVRTVRRGSTRRIGRPCRPAPAGKPGGCDHLTMVVVSPRV